MEELCIVRKGYFTLLVIGLLFCLCACAKPGSDRPTPEAAKRFLKLRGYEFDDQSFLSAAKAEDEMAVNGFLSAGISPNARDDNGDTALTSAAARGDVKIVNALIRGGADVNAKGRNNWTAFLLALESERNDVADILLAQSNLDLKAETPDGMTALMLSVWHQREQTVRKLLARGADKDHQDKDGDTSLHGAAWFGNEKILGMLLDAGANPNVKNKLGGTALMWAASYGQDEAVQILLAKGADPKLRDIDGDTAAGWAAKSGRGNLAMLLREAEKSR
jgi:ankyrin repeat protein